MKKVVFVCTGNTCRSPIAEGFFNKLAKEKEMKWQAESCGVSACENQPASKNAILVMNEYGVDLTGHRSRQADEKILEQADFIICVSKRHLELIASVYPAFKDKLKVLGEDIPDPYGGNLEIYRKTAEVIQKSIEQLIRGSDHGI
ncbi:MAG: low molecular weight protein arginine phosphatase [Clostridiales bacterium]|nr:low molecular weight protein arginine phosphatase [Clostridiales bacterium]